MATAHCQDLDEKLSLNLNNGGNMEIVCVQLGPILLTSFCLQIRFEGKFLTLYFGVIQLLAMRIATYTMRFRFNVVNVLQYPYNRHPIAPL